MQYEQSPNHSFEALYLRERRKAIIFITTTIIMALLFAGSLVYSFNKASEPVSTAPITGTPNASGSGPIMMGSGGNGSKMIMPSGKASDFLNADGSVNTALIQENVSSKQAPSSMLQAMLEARERQIDEELASGGMTSQQATALKEAWRTAVGSSNAN